MKLCVIGGAGARSAFLTKSLVKAAGDIRVDEIVLLDNDREKLRTYGEISKELARRLEGKEPINFPRETAMGAMALYISDPSVVNFQPMNVNFGLIPPLGYRVKGKRNKNAELSKRALEALGQLDLE